MKGWWHRRPAQTSEVIAGTRETSILLAEPYTQPSIGRRVSMILTTFS